MSARHAPLVHGPYYSVDGAATYLSVSRSTIYRLVRDGTLFVTRIRGMTRIAQNDLNVLASERSDHAYHAGRAEKGVTP